jgi:colanic acid/amylovoran biosynthesis glycosyltransferase
MAAAKALTDTEQDSRVLRLAYVVSQYPTTNHTFILREVRALRHLGFDVQVASMRPPDRPAAQLTSDEREEFDRCWYIKPAGIPGAVAATVRTLLTHPLGWLRGLAYAFRLAGTNLSALGRNLFYFVEAVMAGDWMRRRGVTHAHTHFSSTVVLLLQRVFPFSVSMTLHGSAEFYDPDGFYLAQKIAASRFLIAISRYGRSQMMKSSGSSDWDKIEVCPLGVDPGIFTPGAFRADPGTFTITCVGQLAPAKGQPLLVSAIAKLLERGRSVRLRLIGDGPLRPDIENQIVRLNLQRHVVLEGALNQDRVRAIYAETDIYVLPSFAEGIPVVLMEAMAMQIPCVASWITGVPELIRDGVDGLLIPPADDDALARAIERLMDDAALRRRLGESGRARVSELYDLRRNTERLAEIFRRRLEASGC